MAEKKVYMVRHGVIQSNLEEVYSGRSEESLTEQGAMEAENLGRDLKTYGIELIYASPLRRTLQTAEILNRHIRVPLLQEPDLTEMDLGPWTGLSKSEVAAAYPNDYTIWVERPGEFHAAGMETLVEIQKRTTRALNAFLRGRQETSAVMVTHAVVIKCAFLVLNGLDLNSYHEVPVLNLSVHQVLFTPQGGWKMTVLEP